MKLYFQILKLLFQKFILKKNNGVIIREFSEKMGIVYIKLAQILATQNFGNLFTENDRKLLSSICDDCNSIDYNEIEEILKQEYGTDLEKIFSFIDQKPVGSASVSQVHRGVLKTGEEVAIKIKRKDITKTIENISQYGFTSAFAKTITNDTMKKDLKNSLENLKEMLDLIEVSYEKTYAKIKHL